MFSEVTKMNIFDIPGHNFDEVPEYFENVISRYKGKISPPKYHHMHRIELLTTVINHLERIRSNSEKELSKQPNSGPRILPVHKGYTVDMKLRQFKKATPNQLHELIPFDSEKGEELFYSLLEESIDIV